MNVSNTEFNNHLYIIICISIIIYIQYIIPHIPNNIYKLLKQPWAKITILLMIYLLSIYHINISILLVIAFIMTLNAIYENEIKNNNNQIENFLQKF
mgnify:CR=1 FL=1